MNIRPVLLIAWLVAWFLFVVCPTITRAAERPMVVLISGEFEYSSMITLPAFKEYLEAHHGLRCIYLERTAGEDIPGLEALDQADLVILCIRRMTSPEAQLNRFRNHVNSGRSLIGFRTASHAFENWKAWDNAVLGGNYHGHHGNTLTATARINPAAKGHPILQGVAAEFVTGGSLYQTSPLTTPDPPLLIGSVAGQPPEPMAWTHHYQNGRIFYTSLGDPKDFASQPFMQMMVNTVLWALDKPTSAKAAKAITSFQPKNIDLGRFEHLASHKAFTVVDVRSAGEFAAGHVARAINLDINTPGFEASTAQLDKNAPCVLHCQSGARSTKAADRLQELGFKFVYNFTGGMNEWEKAGKKVVK